MGGFNESLDVGCDVDIGHRLTAAGGILSSEPQAVVYHLQRDSLRSYAKQQITTGKNVPRLILNNRTRIQRSAIDTPLMYAEPVLFVCCLALVAVGLLLSPFLLAIGGLLGFSLLVMYVARTVEISLRQRRWDTILLPPLYTFRLLCWTIGGASAIPGIVRNHKTKNGK